MAKAVGLCRCPDASSSPEVAPFARRLSLPITSAVPNRRRPSTTSRLWHEAVHCFYQGRKHEREVHKPCSRQTAEIGQSGATDVPPHTSGATSASVSENVHWWPAGSSAVYCRSPYGKSVGSMTMRAPC